ncbi:futalosine hydrolase [Streptomyces sp. NPDC048248]|uniref:futalosine hydrolase n=1 Tax=Streptomyces sp. NPDC048248 TaxID=3365523 RepID=UPI00371919DA
MRVLAVTAVAAERDAVCAAAGPHDTSPLPGGYDLRRAARPAGPHPAATLDALAVGVGPAAAAAGTATALTAAALAGEPYDLVVSAGIGGGFAPGAPLGSVVVADAIVAADLGAETPEGFVPVTELGFGTVAHRPDPALVKAVASASGAATGAVLTVSTVTGSATRAAELAARHPGALAEAMEGFGVAEAAAAHGVAVLEIRAVSNGVGPRDRASWRIGEALAALTEVFRTLLDALPAAPPTGSGPAPEQPTSPRRTP